MKDILHQITILIPYIILIAILKITVYAYRRPNQVLILLIPKSITIIKIINIKKETLPIFIIL
jgi:hypothetical protein